MYEWHISQEEMEATSIFIPRQKVSMKKVNFMDVLLAVPGDEVRSMQLAIERLAFRLQFSVVPDAFRESSSDIETVNGECVCCAPETGSGCVYMSISALHMLVIVIRCDVM